MAEIDPEVTAVARRYFLLPTSERLRISSGADGRRFVASTAQTYDLILADVFTSAGRVPFHLLTREYFRLLKSRLGPRGVVAFNLGGSLGGPESRLPLAVYKTLREVFPEVYIFPNYWNTPPGLTQKRNLFLVGTVSADRLSIQEIEGIAGALESSGRVKADLKRHAGGLWMPDPGDPVFQEAPILTDDFAPVDSLIWD